MPPIATAVNHGGRSRSVDTGTVRSAAAAQAARQPQMPRPSPAGPAAPRESAGRHGAGTDVANVPRPNRAGIHVGVRSAFWSPRSGVPSPAPTHAMSGISASAEQRARDDDSRLPVAQDEPDAHQGRGQFESQLCLSVEAATRATSWPNEEQQRHGDLHHGPHRHAAKDPDAIAGRHGGGSQHRGAGRASGYGSSACELDDEQASKRDQRSRPRARPFEQERPHHLEVRRPSPTRTGPES
jgi:hypothetical protein